MNKKQTLAAASTSVLAAGMAHGGVVWSGPISYEISGSGAYAMDINNDGTTDFNIRFDGFNSPNQLKPFVDCRPGNNPGINPSAWTLSNTNGGAPLTLFGTSIDTNYAAIYPTNKVAYLYQQYDNNTVVGDWPDNADTEGYVGVELNDGTGTSTNYGWIHLVYQASSPSKTLLLVDYAYEDSGKGILAGVTNTPGAPVIYYSPQSATNGTGSTAQMNVVAIADPPPVYQWQAGLNGIYTNLPENGHFSGTTNATLMINGCAMGDALDYIAVVTNSLGSATSSPAHLTVKQIVLAGPYPTQPELLAGVNAHFQIKVISGTPTGYQWRFNGGNLADGAKYIGSGTASLTVSNLAAADMGNYDVVVQSAYGSATSSIVPLTVLATNGGFFEQAILADGPQVYYRLNETGDPSTNGLLAFDNISGLNGVYGGDVQNGNHNYAIAGPRPASGFPGFTSDNAAALIFANDTNGTITLPAWNLNTNAVTITAWINPQGQQSQGTGIVYTRSTNNMVCGLAYYGNADANGNYSLGYNWNDQMGDWNWTSGLLVPQNQWSFVAVVITPTNGTVYVLNTNGLAYSVNAVTNAVQSFNDTIYIGTDPQSSTGARNFNGIIDEVAVFTHSLSMNQVYDLYAAGVGLTVLPPQITQQPVAKQLYAGQTARLLVQAVGPVPLSYQWMAGTGGNYTNLTDSATVSGSTNSALAVQNFGAGNAGNYFVVVSNAGGSVTSSVVSLSVAAKPSDVYGSVALSVAGRGALAAYFPLDETNDPSTGTAVAYDFGGGYDGIYGTGVLNGFNGVPGPRPVDGFPGFASTNYAAMFLTYADGIACPPMYFNTNALTITAWINPASGQRPFAGLVFCRGNDNMVAGLDFTQTNAAGDVCLGYHWDNANDTYGWVSGLVPPPDQWSFVALVMNPATTNATIWMLNANGVSSASNYTSNNLVMQAFDANVYIGDDPRLADGSLVFNGTIDDVGIFTAALTPAQIKTLYNGALGVVTLQIHPVAGGVQIVWPLGTLLESPSLSGPWRTNSAVSPYTLAPGGSAKFYRVVN